MPFYFIFVSSLPDIVPYDTKPVSKHPHGERWSEMFVLKETKNWNDGDLEVSLQYIYIMC